MQKIRITKRFTFEMAHALSGYDGLCKSIHGHSYILWVTLIGHPINDNNNPKNGMVMDFSLLGKIVKEQLISIFDHALVLNKDTSEKNFNEFCSNFGRLVYVDYQPTCENLLKDFVNRLQPLLSDTIELYSLKLQETESSYAEWFACDN